MDIKINVTGQELKLLSLKHHITKWNYGICNICEYKLHYVIMLDKILHDSGCACIDQETFRVKYVESSWDSIAKHLNSLTDKDEIEKAKEIWKL